MSEDKRIERIDHPEGEGVAYRNAGTNAALGIAAYVAVKPHVDKVVVQVVDKVVDTVSPKKKD